MNPFTQARKDIKYISSLMKGLMALDELLEEQGSIEKVAQEAERRAIEAQEELTKAEAALVQVRKDKDELIANSEARAVGIESQARDRLAAAQEAENTAQDVLRSAREEAADIKRQADADAKELLKSAREGTHKKLDGLNKQVEEAEATLTVLNDEVADARVELAGLNEEIQQIVSRFR